MLEDELSAQRLRAMTDPQELLALAWALEPSGGWSERATALDRLAQVLTAGGVRPAPPGRDWRLELDAERSIDAGRHRELEKAEALADRVLREADPACLTAIGRAWLSRGQALAWIGTDEATRASRRAFLQAAERFAELPNRDWQASALLRCGYSACYQHGDLLAAEAFIAQAL